MKPKTRHIISEYEEVLTEMCNEFADEDRLSVFNFVVKVLDKVVTVDSSVCTNRPMAIQSSIKHNPAQTEVCAKCGKVYPAPNAYGYERSWLCHDCRMDNSTHHHRTLAHNLGFVRDLLPHGAGFDSPWNMRLNYDSNAIKATSRFNSMTEDGMYCHNVPFEVNIIQRSEGLMVDRVVLLVDEPCPLCTEGLVDYIWNEVQEALNG